MVTRRQKRVSELIRQEIGDLLERKVADPRLNLVTVTDVEISSDLRHAR
ncbi:MAG TPA: ribosome-binding factor A, partial [Chloroflexi bacterium]|nr:ribosome-binding factor A [Chloroflexota bacterium]